MPSNGTYFFSVFLTGPSMERGFFDLRINGNLLCTVIVEQDQTPADPITGACSATIHAAEGI